MTWSGTFLAFPVGMSNVCACEQPTSACPNRTALVASDSISLRLYASKNVFKRPLEKCGFTQWHRNVKSMTQRFAVGTQSHIALDACRNIDIVRHNTG